MKEHEQTLVEYRLTEARESLAEAKVLLREKMSNRSVMNHKAIEKNSPSYLHERSGSKLPDPYSRREDVFNPNCTLKSVASTIGLMLRCCFSILTMP